MEFTEYTEEEKVAIATVEGAFAREMNNNDYFLSNIYKRNFYQYFKIRITTDPVKQEDKDKLYDKDYIHILIKCNKCRKDMEYRVYSWFYDNINVWEYCHPSPVYLELYFYFLIIHFRNCPMHYDEFDDRKKMMIEKFLSANPKFKTNLSKCFDSECACHHKDKIGNEFEIKVYDGIKYIESTKSKKGKSIKFPYEQKHSDSHYIDSNEVYNIIKNYKDIKLDFDKLKKRYNI